LCPCGEIPFKRFTEDSCLATQCANYKSFVGNNPAEKRQVIDVARNRSLESSGDYMKSYPRLTSVIIALSLGYATPSRAAQILKDAHERRENWCEWIYSCYNRDPLPAVRYAIKSRHTLRGYMADYPTALAITRRAIETGDEPIFASWF
jgi:hypothetical protein